MLSYITVLTLRYTAITKDQLCYKQELCYNITLHVGQLIWASLSEPHTIELCCKKICAYLWWHMASVVPLARAPFQ